VSGKLYYFSGAFSSRFGNYRDSGEVGFKSFGSPVVQVRHVRSTPVDIVIRISLCAVSLNFIFIYPRNNCASALSCLPLTVFFGHEFL